VPDDHEPGHDCRPRVRNIGRVYTAAGDEISIDHLYHPDPDPCPACGGKCETVGAVGLTVNGEFAPLDPEEALLVVNRLARGVSIALETMEEPPDLAREIARFAGDPPA